MTTSLRSVSALWLLLGAAWLQAAPVDNLVPNASLEVADAEDATAPAQWSVPHIPGSQATWEEAVAHTGLRSLRLTGNVPEKMAENVTAWRLNMKLPSPGKVLVSVWIKAAEVAPESRGSFNVLFKDKGGQVLANRPVTRFHGTFDWQQYQALLDAPEGTVALQLVAGLQRATGTVWFDDFDVRVIDSVEAAFGTARLLTTEAFPVNTQQTYEIEYTVGTQPLPPGARLRVAFDRWREEREWRRVQKLEGAVSRPGYAVELSHQAVGNTWPRPANPAWFTAALTGEGPGLQEGDQLRFRITCLTTQTVYGDTVLQMGVNATGAGAFLPVAEPLVLRVVAGPPTALRLFARSRPLVGEPFRVLACFVDEFDNPVPGAAGTVRLSCDQPTVRLPEPLTLGVGDNWGTEAECVASRPGVYRLRARETRTGLAAVSNPLSVRAASEELPVFFGDIHVHCSLSGDAVTPPTDAYRYGRQVTGLDFAGLADHSPRGERWEQVKQATAKYNDPGRYATILGYELGWQKYGHKNVYFRGGDGPALAGPQAADPLKLWESLGDLEALTIPHHTNTTAGLKGVKNQPWIQHDFSLKNERFQRLIEICQNRGSFEQDQVDPALRVVRGGYGSSYQDALRLGHRAGALGSTDNHQGRPAGGPALAAVFAPELTRDAIWTALRDRRCYATSGARILLNATLNGAPMGSEIKSAPATPRLFTVTVLGTGPLRQVDLIRNGEVIYTKREPADQVAFEFRDPAPLAGEAYYYARVIQEDTQMAWSSPVWVAVGK